MLSHGALIDTVALEGSTVSLGHYSAFSAWLRLKFTLRRMQNGRHLERW